MSPAARQTLIRYRQLRAFGVDHLRGAARTEWQLGLLALVGIAPGVATLVAWLNLAVALRGQGGAHLLGWLLPEVILDRLGAEGVLIGAGMVTLLIGCLGLTNAYLASLERRRPQLLLLQRLGLRHHELLGLLALEVGAIGLLGCGVGLALGLLLSRLTWNTAVHYLALSFAYRLTPVAILGALAIGLLAVLIFLQTAAHLTLLLPARSRQSTAAIAHTVINRNSWLGAGYGMLLTALAGLLVLPLQAALLLALLAGGIGALLNSGGWLLTHLYRRLPLSPTYPLWTMAVQGLARHPNYTAGMTLAMTSGAYAVGMAELSWLVSNGFARFPFWVAALILLAGATLVFTAALAVLERRAELAILHALGARRWRLRQLILLEYGIVAIGGGSVGALLALLNWVAAGQWDHWLWALALVLADLMGALLSAWMGALPVLWQLMRPSQVRSA
ncbi:MAG: ABC transporter permease [Caldilineaceae bacterium]